MASHKSLSIGVKSATPPKTVSFKKGQAFPRALSKSPSRMSRLSVNEMRRASVVRAESAAHAELVRSTSSHSGGLEEMIEQSVGRMKSVGSRLGFAIAAFADAELALAERLRTPMLGLDSDAALNFASRRHERNSYRKASVVLPSTLTSTLEKQQHFNLVTRATSVAYRLTNVTIFVIFVGAGLYIHSHFQLPVEWVTQPQGGMFFSA